MRARHVVLMAGLGLLAVETAPSAHAATISCSAGRYQVLGKALLPGAAAGAVIVVSGDTVSIVGRCAPTPVQLSVAKRGTSVKATWESCEGMSGRVRLVGKI